jgi:hypothetical protein
VRDNLPVPLVVIALLIVGSIIALAQHSTDWERILGGEVIVNAVQKNDGLSGVRAMFTVTAAREQIWAVLLDYENFQQIFYGIEKIKVQEQHASGAQVEFWIDAVLKKYHYVLYRHYEQPGWRLTWQQIAGDLKRIEGSWEIRETPQSGVHMLIYESYVDIGGIVPRAWVQGGALRRARDMGERLRQWIERQPHPK